MEVEGQRVITDTWIKQESGHLTAALLRVEFDLGNVGIICEWPRKDEL